VNFYAQLNVKWGEGKFACVGLDPAEAKLPESVLRDSKSLAAAVIKFCKDIVDATHPYACAFKPNSAFFEALGDEGLAALREVATYARQYAVVIDDAKRGDIGNSNNGYVKSAYDIIGADAMTISPYLGMEANKTFLDRADKGVIVLVRTSNPGAGEIQDLIVDGEPVYLHVARYVAESWNYNKNCAIVVGATYPEELKKVREAVGDMPILIPGIGAQGGDLEASVKAGVDGDGHGIIINSSRGIIYADSSKDFAHAAGIAAKELNDEINQYRRGFKC